MKLRTSGKVMVVVGVLAVILVIYALVSARLSKTGGFSKNRNRAGDTTISVKTQVASRQTLRAYVATNGEVEAQSSIEVFPDIGGKVVATSVQLGSPVKKGQIIAWIDPSEPGTKYEKSPVYAPISGSIVSTPLKDGTTVTTTSSITTIGDVANLQLTADIPERYVAVLHTGLSANITLEAYPDVVFTATVSRVSPVVDSSSRTKEIILTFDRADSRINAGMFAKVTLYTVSYQDRIVMPSDAVVTKNNKTYAYVITADNTAEQREVTLGVSVDGIAEVVSGIAEGDRVVIEGMSVLSDGSKIKDITNGVSTEKKTGGAE